MRNKKLIWTIEAICIWIMCSTMLIIRAECARNVSFRLFWSDLQNKFVDDPVFVAQVKNKLLLLLGLLIIAIVLIVITQSIEWKFKLFGKCFSLSGMRRALKFTNRILCVMLTLLFVCQCFFYLKPAVKYWMEPKWKGDHLVAHAGGGIGETIDYTNSREAVVESLMEGYKAIEIDFSITTDDKLVCWHAWLNPVNDDLGARELSEEEFLSAKIYDTYTPMSWADVINLLQDNEDIYLITDTKDTEWDDVVRDFEILVQTAQEMGADNVLDRVVVQLYNYEMYDAVESVHHFPNYILTLYRIYGYEGEDFISHCRFCRNHNIPIITMWQEWVGENNMEIAKQYGLDIYVHTVNDLELLEESVEYGVKGFYTDYITPNTYNFE